MSPFEERHLPRLFLRAEVLAYVRATRSTPGISHLTLLGSLTTFPCTATSLFPRHGTRSGRVRGTGSARMRARPCRPAASGLGDRVGVVADGPSLTLALAAGRAGEACGAKGISSLRPWGDVPVSQVPKAGSIGPAWRETRESVRMAWERASGACPGRRFLPLRIRRWPASSRCPRPWSTRSPRARSWSGPPASPRSRGSGYAFAFAPRRPPFGAGAGATAPHGRHGRKRPRVAPETKATSGVTAKRHGATAVRLQDALYIHTRDFVLPRVRTALSNPLRVAVSPMIARRACPA
jgi:hypothetical protein